jgi:CRP-like cAMP-binding protein
MLLRNFLRTQPGFQFMHEQDIEHLASAMRVETYPDRHVFIYQDQLAKELFLLLEGKVNVCHYGRSGRYHSVRTLEAGDFFGMLSLSDGKPSVASCTAMGQVKVASLPFSAYVLLYQPGSEIGCSFQYVIASQLARQLRDRHGMLRNLLGQIYAGQQIGQQAPCAMKGPAEEA